MTVCGTGTVSLTIDGAGAAHAIKTNPSRIRIPIVFLIVVYLQRFCESQCRDTRFITSICGEGFGKPRQVVPGWSENNKRADCLSQSARVCDPRHQGHLPEYKGSWSKSSIRRVTDWCEIRHFSTNSQTPADRTKKTDWVIFPISPFDLETSACRDWYPRSGDLARVRLCDRFGHKEIAKADGEQ